LRRDLEPRSQGGERFLQGRRSVSRRQRYDASWHERNLPLPHPSRTAEQQV